VGGQAALFLALATELDVIGWGRVRRLTIGRRFSGLAARSRSPLSTSEPSGG
jgi:hypothetical protein